MRKKLFEVLIKLTIHKTNHVLIAMLIFTVLMMIPAGMLKMDFNWVHLLPEEMPVVKEYKKIQHEHNDFSMLMVTIKGENRERMIEAAEDTVRILRSQSEILRHVDLKMPVEFLNKHMMMSLEPKDVKRMIKIYSNPSLPDLLKNINDDLQKTYIGGEDDLQENESEIVGFLDSMNQGLRYINNYLINSSNPNALLKKTVNYFTLGEGYYFSLDGKMLMVLASTTEGWIDNTEAWAEATNTIEKALQPIFKKYTDLQIGLTGMLPVGRDEIESIGPYTIVLSIIALILILILLIFSFRIISAPILAVIPLIAAIIWDMGFIAITIGYLNIFTAVIMLVLLGLGIDFSIHIISRFTEEISHGASLEDSIRTTLLKSGSGIITGGLTTALAFLTLIVAENAGIRQFGLTAGMGIVFSLISVFLILPAMLVARAKRLEGRSKIVSPAKVEFTFLGKIGNAISRVPLLFFILSTAISILLYMQIKNIEWEYNLLKLEPKGLESVKLYDEILDKYQMSASLSFVTVADLEEARKVAKEFKKKKTVGQIDSLSDFIRPIEEQNQSTKIVASFNQEIKNTEYSNISHAIIKDQLIQEVKSLENNLVELGDLAYIGGQDRVESKIKKILDTDKMGKPGRNAITQILIDTINSTAGTDKIRLLVEKFFPIMKKKIFNISNPEKITQKMLPEELVAKYKGGKTGNYMISIFPKEDIYSREPLNRFLDQVNPVKEGVTGMPQLIVAMIDATRTDGERTVLTAIFVILLVLYLDFSGKKLSLKILYTLIGLIILILSQFGIYPLIYAFLIFIFLVIADYKGWGWVILAVIPIITGFLWMLGMMGMLGIDLNYANMIALPIILGIGIDDGVHVLHRYREEDDPNISYVLTWIGKAIMLTTLTTMIGFGSVAFYTHVGMATMGYVLVLGVCACFLTTVFIQVPILRLRQILINRFNNK